MTNLHRIGLIFCLSGIILVFIGFYVAGTIGVIEFSSRYFWLFVLFPLLIATAVTGLSWRWPVIGGSVGVVTPLALFFVTEMESLYFYLYSAAASLFFIGGVLLLITSVKTARE